MNTKLIAYSLSFLFMSSCASIIHGPTQTIEFTSSPSKATLSIDGAEMGQTPYLIDLRRKGRAKWDKSKKTWYEIQIALEGYETFEMRIHRESDMWFFGNFFFGGLVGFIIDAANGSMYKLTPPQLHAYLGKSSAMHHSKDDKIYFAVTLEPDPEWEKIDQLKIVKE